MHVFLFLNADDTRRSLHKNTIAFNYDASCFMNNFLKHTRRIEDVSLLQFLLITEDISVFNLSHASVMQYHTYAI